MKLASVVAVALFAFLTSSYALGSTIHVPKDQPTIQAGIDAANPGDTVLVAPGKYTENIDFKGKAITVKSSGGSKVTFIDGGGVGTVVSFVSHEGKGSVLRGFTLQNGVQTYNGGGVFINNSRQPSARM